jgi:putative PIN family toxin of toxin-antitoxin system
MIRAVLDTNILVSALLSPFGNEAQVLGAVRKDLLVPCLSELILEEYSTVLPRPKFGFKREEVLGLLGMLRARGLHFEPDSAAGVSPDPGDDRFIACALAANADFIVTGNQRHFPAASCGISRVVSARELLAALHEPQVGG